MVKCLSNGVKRVITINIYGLKELNGGRAFFTSFSQVLVGNTRNAFLVFVSVGVSIKYVDCIFCMAKYIFSDR